MRLNPLALLIACCLPLTGADDPAAATLVEPDGKTKEVFVLSETVDAVAFVFPDAKGQPGGAESSTPRKTLKEVRYKEPSDVNWLKAEANHRAGQHEKAAASYLAASTESRFAWVREQSFLNAGRSYFLLKKYDEALQVVARLESTCPKSVHLPAAYDLRVQASLDKGDKPALEAAVATLTKRLGELGPRSLATLTRAEAALRRLDKKPAEAAAKIKEGLAKLTVEAAPEQYGELMQLLAEDQRAARQDAEALATLRRLIFMPVDADIQANAHLEVAKVLGERSELKDLAQAFDHAVLAWAVGRDGRLRASAIGQARLVVGKLEKDARYDKDAAFTEEVKEYRANLNNFN